jgi:dATP pyrophosphohydrolase
MTNKIKKAQVLITVFDETGHNFDILLLETNEKRGSFWQNVTGKIEEGETIEEGGLREAIEETKLNIENIIDIINLGLSFDFVDQRKRSVHEECFLIILDSKWNVKIDPHEHQDFKWIPLDSINEESVKFSSNFQALEKARKLLRHWCG